MKFLPKKFLGSQAPRLPSSHASNPVRGFELHKGVTSPRLQLGVVTLTSIGISSFP
jgi:hypothetical protein